MRENLKRRLTDSDFLLILVNLVPIIGVWFYDWDPNQVFLVYCLESVIIGGYNVIKMLVTTFFGYAKDDPLQIKGLGYFGGLFLVAFFIIHYGFFIFVQMSIFLSISQLQTNVKSPMDFIRFLFHIKDYLSPTLFMLLLAFVISYGFMMLKHFIIPGTYKKTSVITLMFMPYPRIIVQQITVILGSMFLAFGGGKIFILIFACIKILIEVMIDYDKIIKDKINPKIEEAKNRSLQE